MRSLMIALVPLLLGAGASLAQQQGAGSGLGNGVNAAPGTPTGSRNNAPDVQNQGVRKSGANPNRPKSDEEMADQAMTDQQKAIKKAGDNKGADPRRLKAERPAQPAVPDGTKDRGPRTTPP